MRILIGSIYHESNSFNPIITSEDDFTVYYKADIFNHLRKNDSLTGIIETLKGHELLPTISARAIPNGEVDQFFYHKIKKYILNQIDLYLEEGIDAVCLALHGSMRVVNIGDAEGDLLAAIREKLPHTPIHVALDMHTTMTDRMFKSANSFAGYKCAPHIDCYETGVLAAKTLLENTEVVMTWIKLPVLIAGEKSETNTEPMLSLMSYLRSVEEKKNILSASYLMGYPWSDNEDSSGCVLLVSKGDCQDLAIDLAERFWAKRFDFKFHTETYAPNKAIEQALKYLDQGIKPVYLSDSGDNPTAGSTGDHTQLLELILKTDYPFETPVIYGGIYDSKALEACRNQEGNQISISLGGLHDPDAKALKLTGKVMKFIDNWSIGGYFKSDIALFRVGHVDIVINENHIGYITPDLYSDLGRNPLDSDLVICKLGYLTDPHRQVAKKSIMALTKGSTNEWIETLNYQKISRPIFPLDNFEYDPRHYIKTKASK